MLALFRGLKMRNNYLTEVAYGWCSMVCESHSTLEKDEDTLLLALEIGFRHISPENGWIDAKLTHMENCQKIVDIVFHSGESEAIADLLCAWTSSSYFHNPHPSLKTCAEYLVGLSHLQPFPPRLQQAIMKSIEFIGLQPFAMVGLERFIWLLDGLHLHTGNVANCEWRRLILGAIQSPEGIQHVPHQYWELLVELVALSPLELPLNAFELHVRTSLEDTQEWDKLECWMGMIWIIRSAGGGMDGELGTEEELERVTQALFQQRPGAIQKLEQWVGRLYDSARRPSKSFQQIFHEVYPKSFQPFFHEAYPNAAQQAAL